MYLSKLTLRKDIGASELMQVFSDVYREHQMLWKLFTDDAEAKRSFLYRRIDGEGRLNYYLLSAHKPSDKKNIWRIDSKIYDPCLSKGQVLSFMVRINPVIKVKVTDGRYQRCDVVMHKKIQLGYGNMPRFERPSLQEIVQESCQEWFSKRATDNGFQLDAKNFSADGYQQHVSYPRKHQRIIFSSVESSGRLAVIDPQRFLVPVMNGLGKSRSFGCGLLLVKKVR